MSIGHASGAGRNGAQLRPAGRSGSRSLHDVADPGANGGTLYGAFRSTCSREISIVAPASLPRRAIIACRRQPVPEARRAGEGRLGQRPISRGKHPSPVREQPAPSKARCLSCTRLDGLHPTRRSESLPPVEVGCRVQSCRTSPHGVRNFSKAASLGGLAPCPLGPPTNSDRSPPATRAR